MVDPFVGDLNELAPGQVFIPPAGQNDERLIECPYGCDRCLGRGVPKASPAGL